jgi:hypothetical protein
LGYNGTQYQLFIDSEKAYDSAEGYYTISSLNLVKCLLSTMP